jgi:tape measure domain-containing protein
VADLDVAVTLSGRDDGLNTTITGAASSLEKLRQAADQTTGILGSLWGSMTQGIGIAGGFRVFEAIGGLLGSAKDAAIGFNQTLDSARATMSRYFDNLQSVNNSIASLNDLAARTPFAFEGLLTAQQRTIGAAQSADQLKQNMDAIAVVAANTGRVSTENMDRISLALGQMQAKGHLAGGEMMQLTEAGVNMGEVLQEHFHVTGAQLQEMISKGKVSAQDVFAAMREYAADPKNREALDKLANTWEGAWSTISDVARTAIAGVFRPFFDLMTEGAVAVANFLQTDAFRAWSEAARIAFEGLAAGVHSVLDFLTPLGQAITTAFSQLTQGDFPGAFATLAAGFTTQLQAIWDGITAFASSMLGAGENVVGEFAHGIMSGAGAALQTAVDFVANVIASFLVGNSPPPAGPLSGIDKAGTTLMETYGTGMQQGLGPSKAAVDQLSDSIRGITAEINSLDMQHTDLKNQIDDAKRGYEDMIHPLEEQLRILKAQGDQEKAKAELAFKMQDVALRQAELEAKGDPVKRAEIAQRLEILKQQQQSLGFEQSLVEVERQKKQLAEDGTKAQLEDLQYERQREAILQRIQDGKKNHKDVEGAESQLQELDLRHKLQDQAREAAAEDNKTKLAQLDLRGQEIAAQKDLDDLTDKGKLAQIAKDKELLGAAKDKYGIEQATAEIAQKQAEGELTDKIRALKDEETARIRPLQEQSILIERQKQDLQEQAKALQLQKSEMAEILAQQRAAETAAKAAAKNTGGSGTATPAGGLHFDLTATQKEAETKIKESGAHLAESLSTGFTDWIRSNFWTGAIGAMGAVGGANIGALIGGSLGSVVPIVGTAIGSLIGGAIGAAIGALSVTTLANMVSAKFQEIVGAPLGEVTSNLIDELRQTFVTEGWGGLVLSILELLAGAIPSLANKLAAWAGALIGWAGPAATRLLGELSTLIASVYHWIEASAGPIATKLYQWELALVKWATDSGPLLLDKLAAILNSMLSWIGANVTVLTSKLLTWATAFVAWVGPKIPELLTALGGLLVKVVEWMGAHLGDLLDALGKWAKEFVEWVGPKIPPLLAELGKLLVSLTDWAVHTALPAIVSKLGEWAAAIVAWVGPRIAPLLLELGSLLLSVTNWLLFTALPAIITQLAKWGAEFVGWVAPQIPLLLLELGVFIGKVLLWIYTDALAALVIQLAKWGTAFVEWLFPSTEPMLTALGDYLTALVTWIYTDALKDIVLQLVKWGTAFVEWVNDPTRTIGEKLGDLLGAISTWITDSIDGLKTDAARLGAGMLAGIEQGLTDNWNSLSDWITEHIGHQLPEWMQTLLGIHSPSTVFHEIGENLIAGLIRGMEAKSGELLNSARSILGRMFEGGDVDDWLKAAVNIAGVGDSWLEGMRRLVGWESSGNPRAVNDTEVLGQHASGLVQMLPSTFRAYRMGDLPDDIFNPISNAVASIRYIKDTYDSVYNIPGIRNDDHDAFPGYAEGGIAWTPQLAHVAEREPELIVPLSRVRPGAPASSAGIDYDRLARAITDNLPPTVIVHGVGLNEVADETVRRQRIATHLRSARKS